MAASLVACGSGTDTTDTASKDATADGVATEEVQSDDENTLTVYAWDENFNIPALKAAGVKIRISLDFRESSGRFTCTQCQRPILEICVYRLF